MPVFPKRRNADVTKKPQAPERQQHERAGLWNRRYGSEVAARDADQCGCGSRQIYAVKRIRGCVAGHAIHPSVRGKVQVAEQGTASRYKPA